MEDEEEEKEDEAEERRWGETEERISGDSMRGEPYVEERASQIGPLALLVARKAGSCQPAYRRRALYGTRGRENERNTELKQETFREGDRRG